MGKQLEKKKLLELKFLYDNYRETIKGGKISTIHHNGGMDVKIMGLAKMAKLIDLIRDKASLILIGNPLLFVRN